MAPRGKHGEWKVRVPPSLREALIKAAKRNGVPINREVVERLAASFGVRDIDTIAHDLRRSVNRIETALGDGGAA